MALEDYKEIVATSASLTAMAQMFAGVFICKDIYKKGSSKGFDPMPFFGGTGMGLLMFQYALILNDTAMINVNCFGMALNICYCIFFYTYAPDKSTVIAVMGKVAAVVALILLYARFEHPDNIEFRYGSLVTILLFFLIASPLFSLGEIMRTKSTAGLPFPLIFMGTLVSFQWLIYGLIIDNGFVINAFAFILSISQLALFVIYPSESAPEASAKKDT